MDTSAFLNNPCSTSEIQYAGSRRLPDYAEAGNRAEGTGSTAKPGGGARARRVAADEAGLPASAASCGRVEAATLEFPAKAFMLELMMKTEAQDS